MEMYSMQWALAVLYVVGGPLVALFLGLGAIPVVMFGLFTRKHRRGIIANRIAWGLSIASVLLSLVMWYELISGRWPDGTPFKYNDPDVAHYLFVGPLEAFCLLACILSTVLRRMRRRE
jgi:hypothetical protein